MQINADLNSRHRSLLLPSVFSLAMFALFLGLGTWQIQRLHWKEGLIAQRQEAVTAPPVAPPRTLAEARGLEFHRIRAEGSYRHGAELYLHAISQDGKPGYHVVTPFLLKDGDFVLVDRGFVPEDKKNPATRVASQYPGEVAVTGLLRLAPDDKPSTFTPDNDPATNRWFYIDLAAMAAADHVARMRPYYLAADATPNPGNYPIGGQSNIDLPNDHLQYAITWYALAALMPILYIMLVRHIRRERQR
jgi:surfeit locus 1 family protein